MNVTIDINLSDYHAFYRHTMRTLASRSDAKLLRIENFYQEIGMVMVGGLVAWAMLAGPEGFTFSIKTAVVILLALAVVAVFVINRYRKLSEPLAGGIFLGRHAMSFTEQGIHDATESYHSFTKWKGVKSVEESRNHLFIFFDTVAAHIIPKRAFSTKHGYRQLVEYVRKHVSGG